MSHNHSPVAMKIFPRLLRVQPGTEKYELTIDNSSSATSDRVLLFRIRRSADQKLLTFSPKKGFVLGNERKVVTVILFNDKFAKAKLLVKVVAVPRDQIIQDFDASWEKGVTACGGEVKKVIEIVNPNFSESVSMSGHDNMSEVSGASWFPDDDHDTASVSALEVTGDSNTLMSETFSLPVPVTATAGALGAASSAAASQPPPSTTHSQVSTSASQLNISSASSTANRSLHDLVAQLSVWLQHSQSHAEPQMENSVDKDQQQQAVLKTAALLLQTIAQQPQSALVPPSALASVSQAPPPAETPSQHQLAVVNALAPSITTIDEGNIHAYSTVNVSPDKFHASSITRDAIPRKVALEVFGDALTDELARSVVELRTCQIIDAHDKLISLDVLGTAVLSLRHFLGALFEVPESTTEESSYLHQASAASRRLQRELATLRVSFLRDNLRALSLRDSHVVSLDTDIVNSFVHLTSLHLNNNRIKVIDGLLHLPQLRFLDLSGNELRSLDHLQLLTSLTTLLAAGNRLDSLDHSITVLVPLADTLSTLDLSGNPVAADFNYADEVLLALPVLRHLDGVDLDQLAHSYTRSSSRNRSHSRLPAFPCLKLDTKYGLHPKEIDSAPRADFEKRVRRALEARSVQQRKSRARGDYLKRREQAQQRGWHEVVPSRHAGDTNACAEQDHEQDEGPEYLDEEGALDPRESLQSYSDRPFPSYAAPPSMTTPTYPMQTPRQSRPSAAALPQRTESRPATPRPIPTPTIKSSTSPPRFAVQTSSSKQRRKSQASPLISHWAGHSQKEAQSPDGRRRSVLDLTDSCKLRMSAFGILRSASQDRGYFSDADTPRTSRGLVEKKLRQEYYEEMQETERYSIWHPRYREPQPVFGYSKPFLLRDRPPQKRYPPLFEKSVQRIRDGFSKLPTHGTFTRASKGLTAEWYPMDYTDLEAIRRQGYFHETIGDIQKDSYRDVRVSNVAPGHNVSASSIHTAGGSAIVSASGSVTLSPSKPGRRTSIGQHVSRQYKQGTGDDLTHSLNLSGNLDAPEHHYAESEAVSVAEPDQLRPRSSLSALFTSVDGHGEPPAAHSDFSALYPQADAGLERDSTSKLSVDTRESNRVEEETPAPLSNGPDEQGEQDMESYLAWLESQYSSAQAFSQPQVQSDDKSRRQSF